MDLFRHMALPSLLLALAPALSVRGQGPATGDAVISECIVQLGDNEIELPATEAGVLVYLGVKEGSHVEGDAEIARIDDRQAQMEKEVAQLAYAAAYKKATEDIEIRYSQAAAEVAKAEWEELQAANARTPGSVTNSDIRKAKLEWDRSKLAIEKAQNDQILARYDAKTKQAEIRAAELKIEQRTIRAPFTGQVIQVLRNEKEWVNPGDPILQVVKLDTLYVEGYVEIAQYDPRQVQNCEVTVDFPVSGGRQAQVRGRIVYVSPLVRYGDGLRYLVRAEIANRQEDGQWVVLPGLQAAMTIHLGSATPNVSSR